MKIPLDAKSGRCLQVIAFFLVIFSAPVAGPAQNTVGVSPTPPTASPSATLDFNSTLLQYEAALRSAGEQHHKFIEHEIDLLRWVISITVPVVGAIFLFLGWKGRREIRAQVDARFKTSVDVVIGERLARFDRFLDENSRKIEKTDHYLELIYDLTFAFHVLSVRLDDPEWDAARHDAEVKLQVWRRELPDSRRLAILLGRLYKHFRNYEAGIRVLSDAMVERDRKHMLRDIDYAALLYNRACYQALNAEQMERSNASRARTLRYQAWKDLNLSIALDPDNHKEAIADPDLQTLWREYRKEELGTMKLSDLEGGKMSSGTSWVTRLLRWLRKPT
jgi:hypothetical protein